MDGRRRPGSARRCGRRALAGLALALAACASPPDRDADGVADREDNCVDVHNPTQYDRDGDGKGHACDHNVYLRAATFDPLAEEERYVPDLTTGSETGYYFLQGHRGADAFLEEELAELGVDVVDHFDGEVYVVRSPLSLARLAALDGVRAAGIYQPANRVEPELVVGRYLAADGTPLPGLGVIALDVWVYRDAAGVAARVRDLGGTARAATDILLLVELPGEWLPDLLRLPDVNLVMPRTVVRTDSDYVAAVTRVAELAELRGLDGEGEVITIADSGLDSGDPATLHPDLVDRLVAIEEWGTGTAADLTGHGTHVAGIAVGTGAASAGRLRGAAPAAGLRFQAVGRPVAEAGTPASEPTFCFGKPKVSLKERKAERPARKPMELAGLPEQYTRLFVGATIHSDSWGSCQSEYTPRVGEIDQFLVDHPAVTVVFAAGNDADHAFLGDDGTVLRRGGDSLTNTARAKNALVVGATGSGRPEVEGAPERVAPFSGRGELAGGRIKPDLVAPGQWVLAPRSRACLDGDAAATVVGDEVVKTKPELSHAQCVGRGLPERVGLPELGGEYMLKSGTSMAAPHVAGLVALVRQWFRRRHAYRQPTAALIRATLINGAVDLPDQGAGLRGALQKPTDCTGYPNPCEGWGRVDAEAALYPAGDPDLVRWVDRVPLDRGSERRRFAVRFAPGVESAAITLVWADRPPETLQNNLDLEVEAPDGTRFLGNTFAAGGGASWPDPPVKDPRLDNNVVEKVVIPAPADGLYRIEVAAARLRRGPQPFALVASPARELE